MRKKYAVSIELYTAVMALVGSLTGAALVLVLAAWPVLGGWLLAFGVAGLMLWSIWRVVTSAAQPMPTPKRPSATVDGRAVRDVEVLQ